MYLEISARRTGKTTRLLEAVNKRVRTNGFYAVVVSTNYTQSQNLERRWLSEYSTKDILNRVRFISQEQVPTYKRYSTKTIYYYDEFDWMRNENVLLDKRYYYTTTLGPGGTVYLELKRMCGNKPRYYSYSNSPSFTYNTAATYYTSTPSVIWDDTGITIGSVSNGWTAESTSTKLKNIWGSSFINIDWK